MCENCEIDTLVIVYITNEQIAELTQKLNQQRFYFTRIASSGGFLQYPNNSLLIGVAHELQRVATIQTNRWDIPLDGVITETNFYMCDNFACKDQIIDNNS